MVGQLVYMFRRRGKGQLTTRNGFWNGPGRVIGVESSTGHHVPRIVWVSWNGFIYKCSPEGLRPVPEDESEFRRLAKQLSEGRLHPEVEAAEQNLREKAGQFHDLTQELPPDDNDFELEDDVQEEPDDDDMGGDDNNDDDDDNPLDGNPPNVLTWRAMMGSLPPEKSVFVSTDPQNIGRNVVEGCHH
jgi:hypothetical protein